MRTRNLGAQHRSIQCACGIHYSGQRQEVDRKFKLHRKYCEEIPSKDFKLPDLRNRDGKNKWIITI